MLETVNADADRVTRLLTELLDVSRIDAGRLELRRQVVDLPRRSRKAFAGRVARGRAGGPLRGRGHRRRCRRSGPTRTSSTRCSATSWRTPSGTVPAPSPTDRRAGRRRGRGRRRPTRARGSRPRRPPGSSPGSGAATAAAAPASGSTSSRGWSRRTAAASRCDAPPPGARPSDSCCPPARPPSCAATPAGAPGPGGLRDCPDPLTAWSCTTVSAPPSDPTPPPCSPPRRSTARRPTRSGRSRPPPTSPRARAPPAPPAPRRPQPAGAGPPRASARCPGRSGPSPGKRVDAAAQARPGGVDARPAPRWRHERDARALAEEAVDVTLPPGRAPRRRPPPADHPRERIDDVFVAMGYEVAEGPEVEHEWFNFDALNFPGDHPAREMQDTLFVDPPEGSGLVLRTHTTPVQVRSLLDRPLPVYVVCPGRVYRADALDATHSPVFAPARGARRRRGPDDGAPARDARRVRGRRCSAPACATRLRPTYFPFTEPSAPSSTCTASPAAARPPRPAASRAGSAPARAGSSGAAAAWSTRTCCERLRRRPGALQRVRVRHGLERTLMFRHGIADIRDFYEGDVRFALPFGLEA